jgi:aryl-phospho-beta-D-glucosidase BglC (GH1 family)
VLRTVKLAEQYKLGILIDLHGAPGSQNGEAHSGVSTGGAALFDGTANTQKTLEVLTFLTQHFASVSNVVGIELLNEPKPNAALESFCKHQNQPASVIDVA